MKQNSQQQIASAIIIAGLIIAGAVLIKDNTKTAVKTTPNNIAGQNIQVREVSKNEHILGNPNAKVMIIEYSDTECPYCKIFHATMHQVIKEKGDKVAWVYRHFPIPQLHKKAFHEAEAIECAWDQGGNEAFWKYTDEVYARTLSNDKLDVSELPKIAQSIGLNLNTFNSCLESGKFAEKVQADMDDGSGAGARGTPTSFILKDGKVVDSVVGAQPIEGLLQQIDAALK